MTRCQKGRATSVALLAMAACSGGTPRPQRAADTTSAAPRMANAVLGVSWSHDGRRLAVSWLRGRRSRIYGLFGPVGDSILPTPSRGRPLTAGQGSHASWSPDGLWVAFATNRRGNSEIYRVRPDGTGPEDLTHSPSNDAEPAYSPDGKRIAFTSDRDGGPPHLYLMKADGSRPHAVAAGPSGAEVHDPAWAPDGRVLAFSVVRGADTTIWVDTLGGGGQGRLGAGRQPAWSADGTHIFFTAADSVFVRPSAGGPARLVVADARAPAPSPDGHWLAFVQGTDSTAVLCLLSLSSKTVTRITR